MQKAIVKEDDEEILPNVHRIASLLKRWLLSTHQSYLNKHEYFLTSMSSGIIDEHQKVEGYCS